MDICPRDKQSWGTGGGGQRQRDYQLMLSKWYHQVKWTLLNTAQQSGSHPWLNLGKTDCSRSVGIWWVSADKLSLWLQSCEARLWYIHSKVSTIIWGIWGNQQSLWEGCSWIPLTAYKPGSINRAIDRVMFEEGCCTRLTFKQSWHYFHQISYASLERPSQLGLVDYCPSLIEGGEKRAVGPS